MGLVVGRGMWGGSSGCYPSRFSGWRCGAPGADEAMCRSCQGSVSGSLDCELYMGYGCGVT